MNIERPLDQEIVYEPWVVVGGNYDAADSPQSILVNGVAATSANGMFSAKVPLVMGNNVITVAAAFRTQTVHASVVVNRATPTITFGNVANGDNVFNDTATIRGVVRGPRNSGLLVNGQPASKSAAGDFFISGVPLNPGVNRIVFQLVRQDDTVVEWPLTLTRDGTKPFVVSVTPTTGYSLPLRSLLTIRARAPTNYATLQLLDRGTVVFEEAVSGDKSERAYVLETRDYVSTDLAIRLLDSARREVFREAVYTRVSRPEELDAEIRAFFRETIHRIAAGDLPGGATSYLPQLQQDFKMLYEDLGSGVPSLMEMMRTIGNITLSGESAEIILHRLEQDGLKGYPVGLMRDSKGIWRISGM